MGCPLLVAALLVGFFLGFPPLPARGDEADTYRAAWRSFREKNFELARDLAEDYLRRQPAGRYRQQALQLLGETAFLQKDYTAAAAAFATLLRSAPADASLEPMLVRLLQSVVQGKRCGSELTSLQSMVFAWPQGGAAAARYWLAECHLQVGDLARAASELRDVVSRRGAEHLRANALRTLAWVEQRLAHEDESIGYYTMFVQEFPRHAFAPEAQFRAAQLYFRTQRYRQAMAQFRALLEHQAARAWHAEARYWAAESAYALGEYREARRQYAAYLQTSPRGAYVAAALLGLAWAASKMADYGGAEQLFLRYAERFSGRGEALAAHYYAAASAAAAGAPSRAIRRLDQFLLLAPGHPLAQQGQHLFFRLATQLAAYDKLEVMLVRLEGASESVTRAMFRYLGDRHAARGRVAAARRWWQRAGREETDPEVRRDLALKVARSLADEGAYDAALREAGAVVAAEPRRDAGAAEQGPRLLTKALVLAAERASQAGALEQALHLYRRSLRTLPEEREGHAPWRAAVRFQVAVLLQRLQRPTQAEAVLKTYLAGGAEKFAEGANFLLVSLYLETGRLARAVQAFQAARRRYPSSHYSLRLQRRAPQLLAAIGQPDRALAGYLDQRFERPHDTLPALRAAQLLLEVGRSTAAVAPLRQASRAGDAAIAAPALYWLAEAYGKAGNERAARSALYELLKRFPQRREWRQIGLARLGAIEERLGNLAKAKALYDELAGLPGAPAIQEVGRERSRMLLSRLTRGRAT
ncbi:MAG: tetratricopeptide repeat protein [Candidatus Tectomicrobia bacterium]|nr:tetratricopeptide repeat protein [Candidatus Tectomicrobia bacterium]